MIFSLRKQGTPQSPNLFKLARADISCQFMKTRSLCRTFYKMNGLLGFSVQILLKYFYYCIVGFTVEIDIYSYIFFLQACFSTIKYKTKRSLHQPLPLHSCWITRIATCFSAKIFASHANWSIKVRTSLIRISVYKAAQFWWLNGNIKFQNRCATMVGQKACV